MPRRLASLLADPAPRRGRTWLTNARVFEATGGPARPNAAVLVEDGLIVRIGDASDAVPDGAEAVDLASRTLMPGLIDAHAHLFSELPAPAEGAEPLWPGVAPHFLAARLQESLRMGITTLRDVGSYGDDVIAARQAMRYGAFRGSRVLTCGRIVSASSPGGRFFNGMYREADGPDEVRKAVREQTRRGADFIKVMSTGARSVELEDPDPAQLTEEEIAALVDEAHRLGYRVASHAEGIDGTELSIRLGVDSVEHGMYLGQRPDLLDAMAEAGQVLVPTLSCFYGVAGLGDQIGIDHSQPPESAHWTPQLVELANYNLEEADRTLKAARAAGVLIALGHDWKPFSNTAIELVRLVAPRADASRGAHRRHRRQCPRPRARPARGHHRGRQARRSPRRRRRPAGRPRRTARPRPDLARTPTRRAGRRRVPGVRGRGGLTFGRRERA